ncbi:MAG: LysR substrate-binding domain-containing protein [Comamonas sp.]
MDLRLLRYFAVLAEELHFGRAAARLHISQPPLSKQIRLLEEELGTPLFLRSQRRVDLTAAGLALKAQAALVFRQMDQAVDVTRQAGLGLWGPLRIGVVSSVMLGQLPQCLREFQKRCPEVRWSLHELQPSSQIEALRQRKLDICLNRAEYSDHELASEALGTEPMAVVMAQEHAMARRATIRLVDLAGQRFISFRRGQSAFASSLHQACLDAGFEPQIYQEVVELQTLLSLVQANLGIGLLPESTREFSPQGVVYRPLSQPAPASTLYATHGRDQLSAATQLFLQTLREFSTARG